MAPNQRTDRRENEAYELESTPSTRALSPVNSNGGRVTPGSSGGVTPGSSGSVTPGSSGSEVARPTSSVRLRTGGASTSPQETNDEAERVRREVREAFPEEECRGSHNFVITIVRELNRFFDRSQVRFASKSRRVRYPCVIAPGPIVGAVSFLLMRATFTSHDKKMELWNLAPLITFAVTTGGVTILGTQLFVGRSGCLKDDSIFWGLLIVLGVLVVMAAFSWYYTVVK